MYEGIVQELINQLAKLPGIGPKSAQRIAFHLLRTDKTETQNLAKILLEVKDKAKFCKICNNISQLELCNICRNPKRQLNTICVVEEPKDIVAIERTHEFKGRYHILGGALNPIEGIGPEHLNIRQLLLRLADNQIVEVILATNPNLEGEATATYLARLLKNLDLKITRLASGLPVGGDLEYADEITLGRAFEGRVEIEN